MVNGFGFYSDALRSIKDAYRPKSNESKGVWEELRGVGREERKDDQISLVGYWVFSINPSARLIDYKEVPLHELLEAFAVWSRNRKDELEFHASINGVKLK